MTKREEYAPTRKTPKTNKAIGRWLTIKREKAKLTIRGAAEVTGIDYAVINRMEEGTFRLSFPNAIIFSEAYDFKLDELAAQAVRDKKDFLV